MQLGQVRDLYELIDQQNKALQPQYDLLDQSITQNDASGQAQIAGLDAARTKEFGAIGQRSQNKGMFFSGFSPDAEADYLGSTYLPALANLQATIANTRTNLLGKKAELWSSAYQRGSDIYESDVNAKRVFDQGVIDRDWQAHLQRVKASDDMKALIASQQFEAGENAKNRAASAASSASSQPSAAQMMSEALSSKTGSDGYVSPGTYQSMKNQWISGGYGNAGQFDQTFSGYRNPKNTAYKLG